MATTAMIAVMSQMFKKVHLVFENAHLLKRDKEDFDSFWLILGYSEEQIEYHVGIDFECSEGDLILVDEADTFMLNQTEKFSIFINDNGCVCFTATPDNSDTKGAEANLIATLDFKRIKYMINNDIEVNDEEINRVVPVADHLAIDEVVVCATQEEKVAQIIKYSKIGPVLVYCEETLSAAIQETASEISVVITENIDHVKLRRLGDAPYKILIAKDSFGMRGVDYRCEKVAMTLVVAKSFDNMREWLQGKNRVCRFGDAG